MFTGCSRDPNVRKQKYLDSGEKYAAEGKYREASIQYLNAIQIDSRFAQAHYDLSQAYLKLGDTNRAFQELNRTVELAPDNYRAHTDLANLLVTVRNPDGTPVQDTLKQAKTHLDILREKQPNNPETHEAWANYDAAQNNIRRRHAGDAAGHRSPIPTAPSPTCCWQFFNCAPICPIKPKPISRRQPKSILSP